MPNKKIIFDANAIIDLHRYSIWSQVIHANRVAITPIINRETRYYKDQSGQKKQINLNREIEAKKIEEIHVSLEDFLSLNNVVSDSFLESIDEGEREVISFLLNTKKKEEYMFCTADKLAIKCLGVLGMRFQGISMQEVLENLPNKVNLSTPAHSKTTFERMLGEGFRDAHMYKKTVFELREESEIEEIYQTASEF